MRMQFHSNPVMHTLIFRKLNYFGFFILKKWRIVSLAFCNFAKSCRVLSSKRWIQFSRQDIRYWSSTSIVAVAVVVLVVSDVRVVDVGSWLADDLESQFISVIIKYINKGVYTDIKTAAQSKMFVFFRSVLTGLFPNAIELNKKWSFIKEQVKWNKIQRKF